jgi:hypothetical protein
MASRIERHLRSEKKNVIFNIKIRKIMLQVTNESYNSKHLYPKEAFHDSFETAHAHGMDNSDIGMIIVILTPKEPSIHMVDKLVLGSVI